MSTIPPVLYCESQLRHEGWKYRNGEKLKWNKINKIKIGNAISVSKRYNLKKKY